MKRNALILALLAIGAAARGGDPRPAPATPVPVLDYFLIVTGSELLRGIYPDRHTHFITGVMEPLGGHCVGSWSVDDSPPDLTEALRYATSKAPVVIVTGGLGPTDDDLTRETVSAFSGIAVKEHAEVLAEMERRYSTPRDQIRRNLRRQALVPVRGGYLKNPHGSAVGLVFDADTNTVIAVPGPPRELQPMMTNEVVPYLQKHFALRTAGAARTLRFVGIGQSAIYQALHGEIAIEPDVVLTSQFEGERVDVTFALRGGSAQDQSRLGEIETRVRERLGEYVYATDGASLEEVVLRTLKARGGGLVVLDAATSGHLYAALSLGREAGAVLRSGIAAPGEKALARAVRAVAAETGAGVEAESRFDRLVHSARTMVGAPECAVLFLGEPVRRGGGELMVPMVWAAPAEQTVVEEVRGSGTSETSRARIATDILNRLRKRLLAAR